MKKLLLTLLLISGSTSILADDDCLELCGSDPCGTIDYEHPRRCEQYQQCIAECTEGK